MIPRDVVFHTGGIGAVSGQAALNIMKELGREQE
jgi:hypothetical protein